MLLHSCFCNVNSLASLGQRRLSNSQASTSESVTSRLVSHAYSFAYEGFPSGFDTTQAVVKPIQEDPALLEAWAETENWSGRNKQLSNESTKAEAEESPASLKINRDLLLYRARQKRQLAFKKRGHAEQLKVLHESEQALQKCISLDPTDPRAYVTLGKVLQQQHRYREARTIYEDAIAVTGGKNAFIWQAWATLEGRSGNLVIARKYFNAAVLVDPSHAAAWHAWGMLEKRDGNLAAAKDLWMKGIKKGKGPPNPHLYQSLAVLAGEMGFVDEARAWFRKGTESIRGAQSHALWHGWALLEERKGEPKVVRYLYKRGLEASPHSRYIHLAWAMFEKSEGEEENARVLLQRGIETNPKDAAIVQAWAVLESEAGQMDKARELFQTASELDPRMTHVWQAWGLLEMKAGRFRQARHLFQSGIWSSGPHAQTCHVWQAWATLEYRAGNLALARSMYNCAVKADPSSEKAWKSWRHMEEELGETRRVIVLDKAMQKGGNPSILPKSFATPEAISMDEEPSMLDTVVNTVNEWMKKLDSQRRVAKRSPPTYLPPKPIEENTARTGEKLPPMRDMMTYSSTPLGLPKS